MEDKKDFDRLFRTYYAQLFLFAKQFLHRDEDCHDAVEDVFEEVWRNFARIQQEAALTYLYTCLRRNCIDRLRRDKVHQRYIDLHSVLSERFTTTDGIREMQERERYIEEVLASLEPPTQQIFILCYVEHKKYAEAAELLDISTNTVKKHIVKALKIIAEKRTRLD